mmetsp:Transcript_36424/g.45527  ORF Transcript_36424/g.45527 Transcript_36424/m.45527 type:complete len:354 (-) Transcript_36424:811-1872(-)
MLRTRILLILQQIIALILTTHLHLTVYVRQSIATNTHSSYKASWKRWTTWRRQNHEQPYMRTGNSSKILLSFTLDMASKYKGQTINNTISAVRFYHLQQGIELDSRNSILRTVIKGLTTPPTRMAPITAFILRKYLKHRNVNLQTKAVTTTMLSGLLRVREVCPKNLHKFDPTLHLANWRVVFEWGNIHNPHRKCSSHRLRKHWRTPTRAILLINPAKKRTNIYPIVIERTGLQLCAVTYLHKYAISKLTKRRLHKEDPCFQLDQSQVSAIAKRIGRHSRRPGIFNTHSFRSGGASSLFICGCPATTIQLIGRWTSTTFLRYIRFTRSTEWKHGNKLHRALQSAPCCLEYIYI